MILSDISTCAPEKHKREAVDIKTAALLKRLKSLQSVLYAEAKWSLLIILQGMDASGKDGAVKNVFSGVNPMGCRVKSFKVPNGEEVAHDFLWRIHQHTPPRGMIQIFNRSHYEDILVPSVHGLLTPEIIDRRFEHINAFERMLKDNNTIIFKFYLHVSEKEQEKRFGERLSKPEKKWKYQESDLKEARHRAQYQAVYEQILERCSPEIPWTVVPADQKWYRNYVIAKTIVKKLESLEMKYPELPGKETYK